MQIQPPTQKKSAAKIAVILLVLALAGGGAGYYYYFSQQNAPAPDPTADVTVLTATGKSETSFDGKTWKKPAPGETLKKNQWIQNGADGESDLKYGESGFLRLKKDSALQFTSASRFSTLTGRMHVTNGSLLIASGNESLQASALGPSGQGVAYDKKTRFINIPPAALALIKVSSETNSYSVSVLRGLVTIESYEPASSFEITDTETASVSSTGEIKKNKITQDAWREAREAYELKPKTATTEARQMDIAKKSGNFFEYVLDHGTFYQQKWGWCEREFVEPEDGTAPYLETTYDVFPRGSWVGVYFKTRNLDLSQFKGFKIEARKIPGRPHPAFVRLEFKSKAQVLQAYAIKMLSAQWETIEFPVRLSKEALISELTVIFTHEKVGSDKSGGFQVRNFTLIPLTEEELKERASRSDAEAASSKMPVEVGVNQSAITKIRQASAPVFRPAPSARPSAPAVPAEEPEDTSIPESSDLSDF